MTAQQDIITLINEGLDNEAIVAELTANPPEHWYRNLNSRDVLAWLGGSGRMIAMETAAENTALPDDLRGAIKATLIVIRRTDTAIDIRPGAEHHTLLLGCCQPGIDIFALADVQALIESCRLVETPTVEEVAEVRLNHELEARYTAALSAGRGAINDGATDWETVRDAIVAAGDGWGA